jgi:tryptophan 2,3-dioxygenase
VIGEGTPLALAGRMSRELEMGLHLDLSAGGTYRDYLHLDELFAAQQPRTAVHDEMMFIIQHHTSELWIKLLLHELDRAVVLMRDDRLAEALKILARVGQIQRMLFEQWAVLETMTPSEYARFRDALGHASGFQSHQYRALELVLGNKDPGPLRSHEHDPAIHQELARRLAAPSLYDEFLRWLARHGHLIPQDRLERDFTRPVQPSAAVTNAFRLIYEGPEHHHVAYEMCEALVDIEERFQLWRFRHMTAVKRIIGSAPGTGGSSGVGFLKKALDQVFFPEIWDVRSELIRASRPPA